METKPLPDLTGWTRTGTDISRDGIKYERWTPSGKPTERCIDISTDKTLWRSVPEGNPTDAPVRWHHVG